LGGRGGTALIAIAGGGGGGGRGSFSFFVCAIAKQVITTAIAVTGIFFFIHWFCNEMRASFYSINLFEVL
jgi:hypothetical protein